MNTIEDTPSPATVAALLAGYEETLTAHKSRDCHRQITERWYEGEHLGWFVEHDGYVYEGLAADHGEDGPHPSREAALACLVGHLRAAGAAAREDDEAEVGW